MMDEDDAKIVVAQQLEDAAQPFRLRLVETAISHERAGRDARGAGDARDVPDATNERELFRADGLAAHVLAPARVVEGEGGADIGVVIARGDADGAGLADGLQPVPGGICLGLEAEIDEIARYGDEIGLLVL